MTVCCHRAAAGLWNNWLSVAFKMLNDYQTLIDLKLPIDEENAVA